MGYFFVEMINPLRCAWQNHRNGRNTNAKRTQMLWRKEIKSCWKSMSAVRRTSAPKNARKVAEMAFFSPQMFVFVMDVWMCASEREWENANAPREDKEGNDESVSFALAGKMHSLQLNDATWRFDVFVFLNAISHSPFCVVARLHRRTVVSVGNSDIFFLLCALYTERCTNFFSHKCCFSRPLTWKMGNLDT